MLRRTFQLASGIGPWREKDLWARGVLLWDDVPSPGADVLMAPALDDALRERIADARAALDRGDLGALARLLPAREHWRLYPDFAPQAAFFDIEADGDRVPTVVSVFDRDGLHTFIRGRNLDELPALLAASPFWVTFNGGAFDLPVLEAHFGGLPRPALHLDLRHLCRRLRLNASGLKAIEAAMGFSRPPHLMGVGGLEAISLWRAFEDTGDLTALRLLVEYNLYDAVNLRSVAEAGYNRAAEQLAFDDRIPVFERGEVLYDVSKLLLALEQRPHEAARHARVLGVADRHLGED